jgi:thioesterase domain-containing protein
MNELHQQSLSISDMIPEDAAWIDEALEEAALQQLIPVVERLVKVRPLTPESRFIDLTSDIRKAFIFLREFQRRFDFDLPLSAFFDAPTIRDLARVAVTKTTPPLSRLVLLRAGDKNIPPLFLVPGLGGVVFEILELSKQLDYSGPIYGFAAPGLDGVDPPCIDTVQMGQENFELAQEVYPSGPYRFLGHSSGGVSTFEMTRYAGESGAEVDFFGVLDTNFAERAWPVMIWLRHMLQRIGQSGQQESAKATDVSAARSSAARGEKPAEAGGLGRLTRRASRLVAKVMNGLARLKRKIDHRFLSDPTTEAYVKADPYYIPDLPPKFQRVRDAAITMAVCYRPKYCDCELHLFQAEFGDALACDPVLTWSRLVKKIILRPTPGDHISMLVQPHVTEVAREVSLSLSEIEKMRQLKQQQRNAALKL